MADDVEQQVVAEILGALLNTFSLQLGESTDISSYVQLLVLHGTPKTGRELQGRVTILALLGDNYKRTRYLPGGL